jgi:UDP-N-acetylglucosamine 4-epimerase
MTRYDELCAELRAEPRRWLVTGVAGFIGSALLEKLLELGQHVVGLDNFITGHQRNLDDVLAGAGANASRFTFIEGDIRNLDDCARAVEGVDHVLHQAALGSVPRSLHDPLASHAHNVNGFLNLLIAARDAGAKRLVYASSSSVYGDHPHLPKVEDKIGRQLSPYAVTKYINELYAGVIQDCFQLETIGLRYFNIFGRRQDPNGPYAAVIPRWIQALVGGERCAIFGDGDQSRDFCYVDNAVQANLLSATCASAATNRVYNVGVGGRTDLNQLYRIIRDELARDQPELADLEPDYTDPRPGDVRHSQADASALMAATGYQPTHTIEDGLPLTVRWFAARLRAAS